MRRRHGNTLTAALVLTGLIFAVGTGMVAMISGQKRKAEHDKWMAVAQDAAESGLASVLSWGRYQAELTKSLPREWDVADGEVINPLASFWRHEAQRRARTDVPPTPLAATLGDPLNLPPVGSPVAANEDGSIDATHPGEYVVARYGEHTLATFRPRLQVFHMDEQSARMYKIAISGRVWRYQKSGADGGAAPFTNWELVADRVLLATTGRLPLSRFATLIDIDLVRNWVPGELTDGPVHLNRGYVDAQGGFLPLGVTPENGRSQMVLQAPGLFGAVGGVETPVFEDTVSVTFNRAAAAFPDDNARPFPGPLAVQDLPGPLKNYLNTPLRAADMFRSVDNASAMEGKMGPLLLPDPIPLPTNSRNRFLGALGMPSFQDPNGLAWLTGLQDGCYLPTEEMTQGSSSQYGANLKPSGGLYLRGNVEVMRMGIEDATPASSIYAFQVVGLNAAGNGAARRTYTFKVWRDGSGKTELVAHKLGESIGNHNLYDLHNLPSEDGSAASMDDWSVNRVADKCLKATFNRGAGAGWNGTIFVDLAKDDPARVPGTVRFREPGLGAQPLSGHVLALGQVGSTQGAPPLNRWTKTAPGRTSPGGDFATAEVFSSELPLGAGPVPNFGASAPRVTLIAAGNVFLQNHILTHNLLKQVGLPFDQAKAKTGLMKDQVSLAKGRDLFGIVADRQVVVGFAAPRPDSGSRADAGLVVTAAISALGDPAYHYGADRVDPVPSTPGVYEAIPAVGSPDYRAFAYRGSLATEGLIPLMIPGQKEDYEIGQPGAAGWSLPGAHGPSFVNANPIYEAEDGATSAALFATPVANPNLETRGKLVIFGSVIQRKRGVVGMGNRSYDKAYRYDPRLMSVAPPFFPNTVRLVTYVSKSSLSEKTEGAGPPGRRLKVYREAQLQLLNSPPGPPVVGSTR